MDDVVKPRGRPRSPQVRDAILGAARALLQESGIGSVTMEAVAERAGVGKPTVYRWWPNRHAVAMAALMAAPTLNPARRRTRSPLRALREQLLTVADTLDSRQGRSVTAMIAVIFSASAPLHRVTPPSPQSENDDDPCGAWPRD